MSDLIDRQAAIEEIKAVFEWHDTVTMERMIEHFNNLPSAQPVRHGKWKKIRGAINCSACKSSSWSMSFEGLVTGFNYCPNCGAKMREDDEECPEEA